MAAWISKLMNLLSGPIVRRVDAEVRRYHEQESRYHHQALSSLRRSIEPAVLPIVLLNEVAHLQQIPTSFIARQPDLVIIGFAARELRAVFDAARFVDPPVEDESSIAGATLLFLDEYHLIDVLRRLPTLFVPVRNAIIYPFRGDYLDETALRQILHRLGFPEISILQFERISGSVSLSGVSHPNPISSLPMMLSPIAEAESTTNWMVVSRFPVQQ